MPGRNRATQRCGALRTGKYRCTKQCAEGSSSFTLVSVCPTGRSRSPLKGCHHEPLFDECPDQPRDVEWCPHNNSRLCVYATSKLCVASATELITPPGRENAEGSSSSTLVSSLHTIYLKSSLCEDSQEVGDIFWGLALHISMTPLHEGSYRIRVGDKNESPRPCFRSSLHYAPSPRGPLREVLKRARSCQVKSSRLYHD